MTQHGSTPGRPRGRRGRHSNDSSQWQGYEAAPADEREFPDLEPIRPKDARARDGRAPGDWQSQPGQGDFGYPQAGQDPPWAQAVAPGQRTGGQQSLSPQPVSRHARARQQESDEDIPEWAEPDSLAAFSERWHRRGLDSRDERRSDRRKRRRLYIACGGAAAVVIAVLLYFFVGNGSSANVGFGGLITSFEPGELQSVPNACSTVPSSLLSEFLPGTLKEAAPPLNTGANTQCTWTLDNPPSYRVLEVNLQAYSPSALYGNGSATYSAEANFASFEQGFKQPGAKSGQPPATVTDLSNLPGGVESDAFLATQVFDREGTITDAANVVFRYRNVIITVVVQGLDQTTGSKKYGPVSMSDLTNAAQTIAHQVATQIVG